MNAKIARAYLAPQTAAEHTNGPQPFLYPRNRTTSQVLDVGYNKLSNTSGLETLFRLKVLNLEGNDIRRLADLRPLVALGACGLRQLDLTGNYVQEVPR